MAVKVVGLDLSLGASGIAVITDGGVTTHTVETDATSNDLATRLYRQAGICATAMDYIDPAVTLVLVEGPSLHSKWGRPWERAGVWWMVVRAVIRLGVPIVEVSPSSLKKYATGNGNIAKEKVLLAVVRRYPGIEVANNNEADALVLAAMGARALGHPIEESLPVVHLSAMGGVAWPEMAGAS